MKRSIRQLSIDTVTVGVDIWIADRWWQRALGLLATKDLNGVAGLWIQPCNSVHTLGMSYPIDLIFTDRHGLVVGVRDELSPWKLAICKGAYSTLELRAGLRAILGIKVGHRLSLS